MVDRALAVLTEAGFDLAHAFDAHASAAEPGWSTLAGGARLGLLIANTRALWPRFVAARPALGDAPHPLERYLEHTVDAALATIPHARVYYAHRRYPDSYLPFQRLAVATGLGALAPSQLVIHPIHGPWFALRAVLVVTGTPPVRVPIDRACTCTAACEAALAHAQASPGWPAWAAVRDACSLRSSRYSDDQIRYHYSAAWSGLGDSDPPVAVPDRG